MKNYYKLMDSNGIVYRFMVYNSSSLLSINKYPLFLNYSSNYYESMVLAYHSLPSLHGSAVGWLPGPWKLSRRSDSAPSRPGWSGRYRRTRRRGQPKTPWKSGENMGNPDEMWRKRFKKPHEIDEK